jgi:hypothetical protein
MELHLKVIGIMLILLAAIHILFPKYFNWTNEFVSLSLVNRQMVYVHTFFIGLTVFLMGVLCLTLSSDLVHSEFGRRISLGLGIFWTMRLLIQFFVFSKELWKGKTFETSMHVLFSLLWIYLSAIFLMVYFN